jgi:CDGSH-type Zn-finger protein
VSDVELLVRRNGSIKVIGDVILKDQEGNIITPPEKPFKLCRCGASKIKPFCDGTHRVIGWDDTLGLASSPQGS